MNTRNLLTLLTIPVLTGTLVAQQPKSQALLLALGANGKQIATYQWKQKTTVVRKGDAVAYTIEEVRFDSTGQPQRVLLDRSEEKRRGPIASRKAAGVKTAVQDAMRLAARYGTPQEMAAAIRKGEIWEGPTMLRVQARNVVLPIDDVTIEVNGSTFLASKITVSTRYEGDPIHAVFDYRQLPNGPSVLNRMTVRLPEEDVVVTVDTYDFVRLASAVNQ